MDSVSAIWKQRAIAVKYASPPHHLEFLSLLVSMWRHQLVLLSWWEICMVTSRVRKRKTKPWGCPKVFSLIDNVILHWCWIATSCSYYVWHLAKKKNDRRLVTLLKWKTRGWASIMWEFSHCALVASPFCIGTQMYWTFNAVSFFVLPSSPLTLIIAVPHGTVAYHLNWEIGLMLFSEGWSDLFSFWSHGLI